MSVELRRAPAKDILSVEMSEGFRACLADENIVSSVVRFGEIRL
jgi:hypothetical protein